MRITVLAPPEGRPPAPVAARIPMQRVDDERMMGLVDVDTGKPIPVQVDSRARLCWMQDALKPGEQRVYRLESAGFLADASRVVVCEQDDNSALVTQDGRLVAHYRSSETSHRPFLGSVHSPAGHEVTVDAGAKDGAVRMHNLTEHHHSCWSGWGDVNGVDHWTDAPEAGRQRHRRFTLSSSGPVFGRVSALIDWVDSEGKPQFAEQRVYNIFAAANGYRLFDIISRFVMAYGPVTFGDTADGGLCAVRVASALSAAGGGMLRNANDDQGEEDCRGASAAWCDCTGQIDDRFVGVTMIDCASNLRYPTLWNVSADGLLAANPFGVASFMDQGAAQSCGGAGARSFEQNEVVMFRYRLIIHDNAPSPEELGRLAACFTQSLEIRVD